jgi:hypothetical protein
MFEDTMAGSLISARRDEMHSRHRRASKRVGVFAFMIESMDVKEQFSKG